MELVGIISGIASIILFLYTAYDRAQKEGAFRREVEELRKDVDHANERCRLLEGATQGSAVKMQELSTKIDFMSDAIQEIKLMLEEMRKKRGAG